MRKGTRAPSIISAPSSFSRPHLHSNVDSIFGQQGSRSPFQGHHDLSPFSTTENHFDLPPRCHRYLSPCRAVQMPSVARPDVHSSSAREGVVDHVLVHQSRVPPKGSV